MPSRPILEEVRQLQNVCQRLELLAEDHPSVTDAVLSICASIRSTATLLEVLVATRLR
jgi:hypothetical protein